MTWAFPKFLDATMRRDFTSCDQKWVYSHLEQLALGEVSIHLTTGAAFARGLEVTRKLYYGQNLPLDEAIFHGKYAVICTWLKERSPDQPKWSWEGIGNKSLDGAIEALDFYFSTWAPATDHVQPLMLDKGHGLEPAVEFTFAIPLPGCNHPDTGEPILYTGRFDMLGIYNGMLYVVDEKTTSSLGQYWPKQWDMRSQFTGYCWAAREYGHPVVGALVRGISFLKGRFEPAEAVSERQPWKIDRWLDQVQRNFQDMVAIYRGERPVNLNLDESCNAYGGCPYKLLCDSVDPEPWKANYIKRAWDPLAKV